MNDLFLIAHKVRGKPAFDIATHMQCPKCTGQGWVANADTCEGFRCDACDEQGHWWIIPTSGHRAFPYWSIEISALEFYREDKEVAYHVVDCPQMPSALRDHYTTEREASVNLIHALGLIKPVVPSAPIKRRF